MTARLCFEGLHTPHDKGLGALVAKVLQTQPMAQWWAGLCSTSITHEDGAWASPPLPAPVPSPPGQPVF